MSDNEIEEIRQISNEKRKGPAIRKLALAALSLQKRDALRQKIMTGEWSVEIPDIKKLREDRNP